MAIIYCIRTETIFLKKFVDIYFVLVSVDYFIDFWDLKSKANCAKLPLSKIKANQTPEICLNQNYKELAIIISWMYFCLLYDLK